MKVDIGLNNKHINLMIKNLSDKLNVLTNQIKDLDQIVQSKATERPPNNEYVSDGRQFLYNVVNSIKNFDGPDNLNKYKAHENCQVYPCMPDLEETVIDPPLKHLRSFQCALAQEYETKFLKTEQDNSSTVSPGIAYDTLAYVLEVLTDRTDTLLVRIKKLETIILKKDTGNCDDVTISEHESVVHTLNNCLESYSGLVSDFRELQKKVLSINAAIEKILLSTQQVSLELDKSSKIPSINELKNNKQFLTSMDRNTKSTWREGVNCDDSTFELSSVYAQQQAPKGPFQQDMYNLNKKKSMILTSPELTSISGASIDVRTTSSLTECGKCILINKDFIQRQLKKGKRKKTSEPSVYSSVNSHKATFIICKCLQEKKMISTDNRSTQVSHLDFVDSEMEASPKAMHECISCKSCKNRSISTPKYRISNEVQTETKSMICSNDTIQPAKTSDEIMQCSLSSNLSNSSKFLRTTGTTGTMYMTSSSMVDASAQTHRRKIQTNCTLL